MAPVDYSKWDALELSDDSDIEVHPNVDKRSFIRAKQSQIHQERQQRKQRMAALKYEVLLHQELLKRISALAASLKSRAAEAATRNPGELAFEAVMESAGDQADDALPELPEGLRTDPAQPKTYSAMMAGLLDQISKAMDEKKPSDRYTAMLQEIEQHEGQVRTLIKDSGEELAKLEEEERKKITSESIHTGFDSSFVSKAPSSEAGSTTIELLNPNYNPETASSSSAAPENGASASRDDDEDDLEATPTTKKFANIKPSDYSASMEYLYRNPDILTERDSDSILVLAFNAALEKKGDLCKDYVHQGVLLKYCRSLGRDGVPLFFKRITSRDPTSAKEMFYKEVHDTWVTMCTRAKEIIDERAKEPVGVEQIQLHAVEPGTVIAINVPAADSEDADVQEAREIFDHFSDDMKAALETGELDKVNEVLGNLSVEDAEEYVTLFGEANILSVEEQVIDATTEEGRQQVKELEAKAKAERAAQRAAEGEAKEGTEEIGDPE